MRLGVEKHQNLSLFPSLNLSNQPMSWKSLKEVITMKLLTVALVLVTFCSASFARMNVNPIKYDESNIVTYAGTLS